MKRECWRDDLEPPPRKTIYLVSAIDGEQKLLKKGLKNLEISPGVDTWILQSKLKRIIFSYEFSSGTTRNITQGLSVNWIESNINNDPLHLKNGGAIGIALHASGQVPFHRKDNLRTVPAGFPSAY